MTRGCGGHMEQCRGWLHGPRGHRVLSQRHTVGWGWLGVPEWSLSWCGRHGVLVLHITPPGKGLGVPVPSALWGQRGCHHVTGNDSGLLPRQRWSNRRRARRHAMTIFTFPETASCSSNLPQLGSLPRQEATVTAAAVGATGTTALGRVRPCPPPHPHPHPCTRGPRQTPSPALPSPLPLSPTAPLPHRYWVPTALLPWAPTPLPRPLRPASPLPALHQPLDAESPLGRGRQQVVT